MYSLKKKMGGIIGKKMQEGQHQNTLREKKRKKECHVLCCSSEEIQLLDVPN